MAHAYLSNNKPELLIGNFIADHIRGNEFDEYDTKIKEGIKLHRNIDAFTDVHPQFKLSKRIFYNGFEKYSGILIDIYYDYFLAKNFEEIANQNLNDFSQNAYGVYDSYKEILPKSSANFLHYVLENDIYCAYSDIKGIERVLFHLSHRIKHGVMLNESLNLFLKHEKELKQHFDVFFSDAKNLFLVNKL